MHYKCCWSTVLIARGILGIFGDVVFLNEYYQRIFRNMNIFVFMFEKFYFDLHFELNLN